MSLRDYFAGQVTLAFLNAAIQTDFGVDENGDQRGADHVYGFVAKQCYDLADAMLHARLAVQS